VVGVAEFSLEHTYSRSEEDTARENGSCQTQQHEQRSWVANASRERNNQSEEDTVNSSKDDQERVWEKIESRLRWMESQLAHWNYDQQQSYQTYHSSCDESRGVSLRSHGKRTRVPKVTMLELKFLCF